MSSGTLPVRIQHVKMVRPNPGCPSGEPGDGVGTMDRLRRHTTGLLTLAILVAMASSPTASFAQKDDLPGLGGGLGLDLPGFGDEAGVSVKSRLTEDPAKPVK